MSEEQTPKEENLSENPQVDSGTNDSATPENETNATDEKPSDIESKEKTLAKKLQSEAPIDPSEPTLPMKTEAEETDAAEAETNSLVKKLEDDAPTDPSDGAIPKKNEDKTIDTSAKEYTKIESEQELSSKEDDLDNDDDDTNEEEVSSSDEEEEEEEEAAEVDYHSLSKTELISALENLLNSGPVQKIKDQVEEIRSEFNSQFNEELSQKKEEFLEAGGNIIDFHYTTPERKAFSSLYFDYKEKRNNYYKSLKKDLQANLDKRQELIEELKGLLNAEENINTTYNHFKDIQQRWYAAGAIPRDKYNLVWNNYHHHVENFYDFLHLNREFRDLDFKHNLEQKLKLISRAEDLAQEENINRAFRELQMLHKMWKEELGPVAKEYREDVWNKFSEATKVIHDKRQAFLAEEEKHYEDNLVRKRALISEINSAKEGVKPSHGAWQQTIKKVQALRDEFFNAGKVPISENKTVWNEFKEATRSFNHAKNAFYKNQKKEQYNNLENKKALIATAQEHKDSDDFDKTTPLMKKIQSDWKKIGHVPRKDSDRIWKEFKSACNHYFDRLHAQKNEANKEELVHFEAKNAFLNELDKLELSGDHKEDLSLIKEKIKTWKEIGRVPYNKKNIEQKFNKKLDSLFAKLDMGKKELELIKFENKISALVSQEDDRKLRNEEFYLGKKVEETKAEIRQLENNLGFFQHVEDDNPLVKDVHKNIDKHKEQLEVWKAKLSKIRSMK